MRMRIIFPDSQLLDTKYVIHNNLIRNLLENAQTNRKLLCIILCGLMVLRNYDVWGWESGAR